MRAHRSHGGHTLLGVIGAEFEHRHHLHQLLRLHFQAAGCRCHFFDQRRVLLGDLVHLGDRFADLCHTLALLVAGGTDLTHDVRHAFDRADHLGHGAARLVHQQRTLLNVLHVGVDQALDFLGRLGRASGQRAHFRSHHGKTTALLPGARRFHGRVERQDVGLEGDAVNDADDVADLARGVVDALHGVHHLRHHFAALHRDRAGAQSQLIGLARVVGVGFDGGAELFHGRRGFFQRAGLTLGAA